PGADRRAEEALTTFRPGLTGHGTWLHSSPMASDYHAIPGGPAPTKREILAHIASIEWSYPRLIDIARTPPAPVEEAPPTRAMKGGNDAYNDRQVAKREGMTVGELLAEFEANRAATIRAVEAADDELFARRIRSAGGVVGPPATVFHQIAVAHVLGHAKDI